VAWSGRSAAASNRDTVETLQPSSPPKLLLGLTSQVADVPKHLGGAGMAGADSKVAVKGLSSPAAERQRTLPAVLARHDCDLEVESRSVEAHAGDLRAARAHVD
jgi:hypothetical protein